METKKEFRYFTIFNHHKEEEYLRTRHSEGWKFIKVTGIGFYHFERCEPDDVVYQLDYNPQNKNKKSEYIQMFEDCGWEYIQDYVDYSYFRKSSCEMNGSEEIFNDEQSKADMLGRVFEGRIRPLYVIFAACLLPQFILSIANGNTVLSTVIGCILLVYVVFFGAWIFFYINKKGK
jgi:lipopolysaccharide export LptBFGC system permease protein LptF